MAYAPTECPGCSGEHFTPEGKAFKCSRCGGLVAEGLYLGDSYSLVLPYFSEEEVPADQTRYFDLSGIGSEGTFRRHGWFDPKTKKLTQVG